MKKASPIPLTDSPRSKTVKKLPLESSNKDFLAEDYSFPDPKNFKTFWKTLDEDNSENN